MVWTTEWAPTARELKACVECGLCLPHCPTFRLTGDETASPRGRLNAMAAVASGQLPLDEAFAGVMDFCLQCRACEAACPSLVPFGRAMEGARAEVAAALPPRRTRRSLAGRWVQRRRMVRVVTFFAAIGQRLGFARLLGGAPGRGLRGLRRLPLAGRTLIGRSLPAERSVERVGLLAGCVMDPWFAPVHEALVALLGSAGISVEVPRGQTCCGALATHEGLPERAEEMRAANRKAFAGLDRLVVDAAGCSAHLKEHDIGVPVVDAVEIVAELIASGRLPTKSPGSVAVGVQDPCHHRHVQKIYAEPRDILTAAGLRPVDVDGSGRCCGAAGLYSLAHPDASDELGRAKAAEVRGLGVDLVASANPGCEMQLRSHLGTPVRVAHPVEIYAEAVGLSSPPR